MRILQLIMPFITYWEALGQVLQNIGINNTKPDGKNCLGQSFFIAAATGGELLNLIIR
jgi:hypothetical protein